mgnify:CR=1 FL=1
MNILVFIRCYQFCLTCSTGSSFVFDQYFSELVMTGVGLLFYLWVYVCMMYVYLL